MRFDRAERNEFAVCCFVYVIEVGAGIEQVRSPTAIPHSHRLHPVHHRCQQSRAIDHRGVHHLSHAGRACVDDSGQDTNGQQHAATAKVAQQIDRRHWRRIFATDHRQRSRQCDVVDVVPGALSPRAVLTPAGHSAVNQSRISLEANFGADAQPFTNTGAKALDQPISRLDQAKQRVDAIGVLEIDAHRAAASVQHISWRRVGVGAANSAGTVDANNFRPKVGEDHRCERPWTHPR